MSKEFKIIYYFEDSSDPAKCVGQVCQSMEGWYDNYPARPHGGLCDCFISPYIFYSDVVYKNFEAIDGGETTFESGTSDTYENPHPTKDMEVTIEVSYEEKQKVEVSVSEIMTHFGFSGSIEITKTIKRTIPVTIPPVSKAFVTLTTSGTVTRFNAEKWVQFNIVAAAFTDPDDTGEVFVENIEGGVMYQEGNQVDFEVTIEDL
jgi:hypothetical protein